MGTNRITTGYGITEGGMSSILFDYTRDEAGLNKFGSSGRCVNDTDIKVIFRSYIKNNFCCLCNMYKNSLQGYD